MRPKTATASLTQAEAQELVECIERLQAAGKMLALLVERAHAQRDEARAEVERLRAQNGGTHEVR